MSLQSHGGATRIRVDAAIETGGPYDVMIRPGCLADIAGLLSKAAPAHRYAIVADATVAELHGRGAAASMRAAGLATELLTFAPGEASKTRASWARLTDGLLDRGVARDGCIVALGGGVTGDLAGFVAATYMRGIPYVNVPTTLLAMVDSSVGGKTGVDVPAGKNLVGAFWQPQLVIVDPLTLGTLPEPVFREGLAEAIKHAVIADADYLSWIDRESDAIGRRDVGALTDLIRRSVEIKASTVAADTLETGPRASLNFGHTLGHALERVTDYRIGHGQAVSIGMVAEARLGERLGVTENGTAQALAAVLARLGLPVDVPPTISRSELVAATQVDKKARAGTVRYALLERAGRIARTSDGQWTFAVPTDPEKIASSPASNAISQTKTEV